MWWQQRLSEFVTLLLVINPVGALPIYLAMAAPLAPAAQRRLALSAVLISFVVLVFFIFAGAFLFARIGIPIRAFQIAGGIVLFLVAVEMIRGEAPVAVPEGTESQAARAVYPLAIPKIAGPGAMLAVVLLTDDDRSNLLGQLATVGILAVVLIVQFLVLLAAAPLSRLIGVAGAAVVSRVMGMLLAALAVSMVLTALAAWLNLPQL
jgi:multiple antibiotic resistance protein